MISLKPWRFCTLGNLVAGRPISTQIAYLSAKALDPLVKLGMLIISALRLKGRSRHRLDRLHRCIRVGSFGIVVVFDTKTLGYELNAVFNCLEFLDHLRIFSSGTPMFIAIATAAITFHGYDGQDSFRSLDIDNHGFFLAVVVYNLRLSGRNLVSRYADWKIYHLDVFLKVSPNSRSTGSS